MILREQARSVYDKHSIMADLEVNATDGNSLSGREEDENALLANDGDEKQVHDTTVVGNKDSGSMWKAIQGLDSWSNYRIQGHF